MLSLDKSSTSGVNLTDKKAERRDSKRGGCGSKVERGIEGECRTKGTKRETSPLGVWESGTGNRPLEGQHEAGLSPGRTAAPSHSPGQFQPEAVAGSGQPASGWRTEDLYTQAASRWPSLCGREGSWLCLPVHSQLWPGVLWDRAHPGKPLTFSRTVCSLDKSQRHPSHKGPIQRLPRPPAASSGGLDISFQSCRDLEDLQVIPPMIKSRKFPQNSVFIASMVVHTYNPRAHWRKQENWTKAEPIWAMQ